MTMPLAFSMPGMPEILVILLIVLILFGAKKLPELARGLAQSLNEFRKARDEFEREVSRPAHEPPIKEPQGKEPARPPQSN